MIQKTITTTTTTLMIGWTMIDRNDVQVFPVQTEIVQNVRIGHDLYELRTVQFDDVRDCRCGCNTANDCVCFAEYHCTRFLDDGTTEKCDEELTEYVHSIAWQKDNAEPPL